jgi:opacity protein-like surface antigen
MDSRKALATGLLLAMSAAAGAQEAPDNAIPRFSLTPIGGYTFGGVFEDEDDTVTVEVDDYAHYGLIADFRESANTQWEVFYSRQESQADISEATPGTPIEDDVVDLHVQYLHIGGTYVADGERMRPYLAATVGATRFDPDPLEFDSENFFSFSLGVGWQMQPTERLGLRLEARAFGTLLNSNNSLFCQTGPDENICVISVKSDIYWQLQSTLGVVFRF